jgi:hypothetical protein
MGVPIGNCPIHGDYYAHYLGGRYGRGCPICTRIRIESDELESERHGASQSSSPKLYRRLWLYAVIGGGIGVTAAGGKGFVVGLLIAVIVGAIIKSATK